MTLILKSDTAIELRDKFENMVAAPLISADFRDGSYKYQGNKVAIEELISVGQENKTGFYNEMGEYVTVPANTARIGTDQETYFKGLLTEPVSVNVFKNSTEPKNQTGVIFQAAGDKIVCAVVGSGSLQLLLDGVDKGVATEDNPITINATAIGQDRSFSVIITGELEYISLNKTTLTLPIPVNRIETKGMYLYSKQDVVSIQPAKSSGVLSNKVGTLVIKVYHPRPSNVSSTEVVVIPTLSVVNTTLKHGFYFGYRPNHSGSTIRSYTGTQVEALAQDEYRDFNTIAVAFTGTSAVAYANGKLIGEIQFSAINYDKIYLADNQNWVSNHQQYLEQFALYDRNLTEREMIKVTSI